MRALAMGAALLLVGVLAVSLLQHYRQRNAVDTPIYADLRQIEFEHRSSRLSGPLFLLGSGPAGDMIGIPSKDTRFPNAWLSADKTQPNGSVYLVPRDTELRAPCLSVTRLLTPLAPTRPVSPLVREFLSRHCTS